MDNLRSPSDKWSLLLLFLFIELMFIDKNEPNKAHWFFSPATSQILAYLAYLAYLPSNTLFHIVRWEQYPDLVIHSVSDKYFYQNLEMTSRLISFHEWGLHHLPLSLQAPSGPFLFYMSQRLNYQSYRL